MPHNCKENFTTLHDPLFYYPSQPRMAVAPWFWRHWELLEKPEHNTDTAIGTSWRNDAHTDRADWAGKKLRFTEHIPHTNFRPSQTWSHSILTSTLPDRYCSPTLQMSTWRRDKSKYSNVCSELTGEPRLESTLSSTPCRLREKSKYLLLGPFLPFIVSPPP